MRSNSKRPGRTPLRNVLSPKTTRARGAQIEAWGCEYLTHQGLLLLERNYHCRYGEIDAIFRDNNATQLVFVEIRFRYKNSHGGAAASVDRKKQQKLIYTATHYLQEKSLYNQISARFDVLAVSWQAQTPIFEWIKNAFEA